MEILVVGAGYLGSELYLQLTSQGYVVHASRMSGQPFNSNNGKVFPLRVDVLDPNSFQSIPRTISVIIYCVAASGRTAENYKHMYCDGVRNLIFYAKKNLESVSRFILISSTGVYTENAGRLVNEQSSTKDSDGLYEFLTLGEKEVINKFPGYGLVLRLSGIYGPHRTHLIEKAKLLNAREEEKIQWTNRIHKEDAARACIHLIKRNAFGIYNVSDTCPARKDEVMQYIRNLLELSDLKSSNVIERENKEIGKKVDISKLLDTAFEFRFPTYKEGYANMIRSGDREVKA